MALTPSTMLALGTVAPRFALFDTEGRRYNLDDMPIQKGLLVVFMCNHCPYVKHIRAKLAEVTSAYIKKGIAVVGINSNDVENYPEDSPEKMRVEKASAKYEFPYLFDETQEVARQYQAACTPDFYLFNANKALVYRGQFDESRPGNKIPVSGADLSKAMDALLAGSPVPSDQKPSIGCNIKWKA